MRNVAFTYRKMFDEFGLQTDVKTLRFDRNIEYDGEYTDYVHFIGSGYSLNIIRDMVFPYRSENLKIYNTTKLRPGDSRSFVLIHDLYYDGSDMKIIRWKHSQTLDIMRKHNIPFITVSNYTAEKLRNIGLDGVVIHPLPYDLQPTIDKDNIILTVGSQEARKNVEFMNFFTSPSFLDHRKYTPIKVGGGLRFGENLFNISNDELNKLYSKSKFLLFPSFDEGFGLPVLEGLLHRCIVISNNIPTSKEIDMGQNIIEFIDVNNSKNLFPNITSFVDEIQDKRRDYEAWFEKYRKMVDDDMRKFVEYIEERGWT
ncbi:MAG: glycosyltransferase [Thermoplasmata archaeon]